MTPEAALGPATPAKKIPNVTGIVTSTASQVIPLTAVPMISPRLPITARPRCAMSLSRLLPPNEAMTRLANPPNAANRAICRLPKPSKVSANRDGITRTARSVRSPAGTDQVGHQAGRVLRPRTSRPRIGPAGGGPPAGGAQCSDRALAQSKKRGTAPPQRRSLNGAG